MCVNESCEGGKSGKHVLASVLNTNSTDTVTLQCSQHPSGDAAMDVEEARVASNDKRLRCSNVVEFANCSLTENWVGLSVYFVPARLYLRKYRLHGKTVKQSQRVNFLKIS